MAELLEAVGELVVEGPIGQDLGLEVLVFALALGEAPALLAEEPRSLQEPLLFADLGVPLALDPRPDRVDLSAEEESELLMARPGRLDLMPLLAVALAEAAQDQARVGELGPEVVDRLLIGHGRRALEGLAVFEDALNRLELRAETDPRALHARQRLVVDPNSLDQEVLVGLEHGRLAGVVEKLAQGGLALVELLEEEVRLLADLLLSRRGLLTPLGLELDLVGLGQGVGVVGAALALRGLVADIDEVGPLDRRHVDPTLKHAPQGLWVRGAAEVELELLSDLGVRLDDLGREAVALEDVDLSAEVLRLDPVPVHDVLGLRRVGGLLGQAEPDRRRVDRRQAVAADRGQDPAHGDDHEHHAEAPLEPEQDRAQVLSVERICLAHRRGEIQVTRGRSPAPTRIEGRGRLSQLRRFAHRKLSGTQMMSPGSRIGSLSIWPSSMILPTGTG